jgi:hypothetical protein
MQSPVARWTSLVGLALWCAPQIHPAGAPATENPSVPPPGEILARLTPGHPRLLVTSGDWARLAARLRADGSLQEWYARLRERGRRLLEEPPSRYEIPDGLRLLGVSRQVVDRVYTLALLYHVEGEADFARRAGRELEAVAAFPDWNPRHFLDTAEMTHAFAIGHDWLFDFWTPEQRAVWMRAIVEKGLKPALEIYRRDSGWSRARHNWNQVCNGGIGVGALAVAEVDPALAGEVLAAALRSIPLALREYGPDGAWAEGPGYWRYATQYTVLFLAALETALGTDFGLGQIPGFADAGLFPLYIAGPLNRTFNYADGGDGPVRAPELFWLARRFHRPEYAHYQVQRAFGLPLDLLWFDPATRPAATRAAAALPRDKYFRGAEVVTLRTAWEDRQALFVGFKAGDNRANHSHLDLGTFVLDALGERWVVDLGADDYNLPAYFGNQRWTYYRLRAEGHNTLVLNPAAGPDQDPRAAGQIVKFESGPGRAVAVADLSAAYAPHARSVRRGLALLDGRQVLVQDEVRAAAPAEFWWFLHTPAEITLGDNGRTATLRLGQRRLWAEVLEPAAARFTVRDARPLPSSPQPEKQNPNAGIRKLAVHMPGISDLRLAVRLVPLRKAAPPPAPALQPLAEW